MLYLLSAGIIAGIVILDQAVKAWICGTLTLGGTRALLPGLLHLSRVHNYGAAFSTMLGQRWLLIALTFLFFLLVAVLLAKKILRSPGELLSLAAVLGGALGNLIDRFRLGYVVDMFALELFDFPVFNVADIFVVCGAIVFCIFFLRSDKRGEAKP